jgi:VWFA-related protein
MSRAGGDGIIFAPNTDGFAFPHDPGLIRTITDRSSGEASVQSAMNSAAHLETRNDRIPAPRAEGKTMQLELLLSKRRLLTLVLLSVLAPAIVHAQQIPKPTPDDVVRVNTELVQTAITVLDKDGHFVDGLNRDQFQLLVDGQPRAISLFDRVTAPGAYEERLKSGADASPARKSTLPTVRGRTVVFFVDDVHMSPDSMKRTRDMLRRFLTTEMSTADSVAIATASGQVGFLEQFTNNTQVLSAAIERLAPRQTEVQSFGTGNTQMREYDALIIDSTDSKKANSDVLNYYIRECVVQSNPPKQVPMARAAIAAACEREVRNSARVVLVQAGQITQNMYATLESLMRSAARSPGRKLAFFISDGFLLDGGPHAPDLRGKLDNIIDDAQRAGVVVYSIDSSGLTNEGVDVRQGNARLDVGAPLGEKESRQDAMNALARDTGGLALRNTNFFDRWVGKILDETSNYYLLAWRPEQETERTPKSRHVQISIVNRPDLIVRAPRGYLASPNSAQIDKLPANQVTRTPEEELRAALTDSHPTSGLPTVLSLAYLNTPKNEMLLTSSVQVGTNALDYGNEGKLPATVRIAGVILNDKGKIAGSFKTQLRLNPQGLGSDNDGVIYNDRTALAPGIYQVRAAATDERSRRVGSAMQWIVIPDLTPHRLMTSSILLGAQVIENKSAKDETAQVQFSVDHRFLRTSHLGYWLFIYNAKHDGKATPNLSIQSDILRDGRAVLTAPTRKIVNAGDDPERIAFAEELALSSLTPGRYDLLVTVKDESNGATTTQQIDFEVR